MELFQCGDREDCPLAVCPVVDTHHLFFPKNEYKTRVEKKFRNLGCNLIEMCRHQHNELHAAGVKPLKPSRDEMLVTIRREYDV